MVKCRSNPAGGGSSSWPPLPSRPEVKSGRLPADFAPLIRAPASRQATLDFFADDSSKYQPANHHRRDNSHAIGY